MKYLLTGCLLVISSLAVGQTYPSAFSKISRLSGNLTAPLNNGAAFGIEASAIGDLNDDGVVDLAVGATNQGGSRVGAVFILFMNPNGTVNHSTQIDNTDPPIEQDSFGSSIAGIGDLDGDGVEDIGVGAGYDSDGGFQTGAYWILFLKTDGTVKARQKISTLQGNFTAPISAGNVFGTGSAAIGDLDHDGVMDIAVGARIPGSVYILFMKTNGTVKTYTQITNGTAGMTIDTDGLFGYGLTALGDVDGDGVPDIGVGGHRSDVTGFDSGVVFVIFLTSAGNVKGFKQIAPGLANFTDPSASLFGVGLVGLGDYDHDGVRDMVVGGMDDGSSTGAIWYIMLKTDGSVKSFYKISSTSGNNDLVLHGGDFFGGSISYLGDLNSDGLPDIAVAAFLDDDGGADSGALWISICGAGGSAGPDKSLCGPLATNMNAVLPSGATGTWSLVSGSGSVANIHDPFTTVTGLGLGANKFAWTVNKSGCSSASQVTLTVNPPPTSQAGADISVCSIQTVYMNAVAVGPGSTGTWSVASGSGSFADNHNSLTKVTNFALGVNKYVWTIVKPGCLNVTDTVLLKVDPVVKPNAGADQSLCKEAPTTAIVLSGNLPVVGPPRWLVIKGVGTINNPNNQTVVVANANVGDNRFAWEFPASPYCPMQRDTVMVTVLNKLSANISMPDTTYTCDPTLTLSANQPASGTGAWSVTQGSASILDKGSTTTSITFSEKNKPVTISWQVTSSGCSSATDYATIVPFDIGRDLPNVITPNGDGKNDHWKIVNLNRANNAVRIYNRWGTLVYSASNYKNDWSGGGLDAGVYYYYIQVGECKTDIKGTISIVR